MIWYKINRASIKIAKLGMDAVAVSYDNNNNNIVFFSSR